MILFDAARSLTRVRGQIVDMRRLVDGPHLLVESTISAWTPAEHLDHVLKVGTAMINRLLKPDLAPLPRGISPLGRVILTIGRIPRGVGKAPERMHGARVTADALRAALDRLDSLLPTLEPAHLDAKRGAIVPHPRFGGLTPAQTLRFTAIHNDHHLRIIEDMVRRRR
jgi:hypothetical protein